jgi:hypothetical protein
MDDRKIGAINLLFRTDYGEIDNPSNCLIFQVKMLPMEGTLIGLDFIVQSSVDWNNCESGVNYE